jgi:hypothetical protein
MEAFNKDYPIGEKFNKLTVIGDAESRYNQRYVEAICECGSIDTYMLSAIKRGAIKSCGCSKKKYPTVKVGDVFGRLTIIELTKVTIASKAKVRCICGKECFVVINKLNTGHTTSCGCFHNEQTGNINKTHGLSQHKLHDLWSGIKKRCRNSKCAKFRYYGGHPTGPVIICDEWFYSFEVFYEWCMANGWEEGLQIDKDKVWEEKHGSYPGKEYSPEYCCFLTKKQNCRNRTSSVFIEYKGEKKTLVEWGEIYGIKASLLSDRLFGLNLTPEVAFNKPVKGSNGYPGSPK